MKERSFTSSLSPWPMMSQEGWLLAGGHGWSPGANCREAARPPHGNLRTSQALSEHVLSGHAELSNIHGHVIRKMWIANAIVGLSPT